MVLWVIAIANDKATFYHCLVFTLLRHFFVLYVFLRYNYDISVIAARLQLGAYLEINDTTAVCFKFTNIKVIFFRHRTLRAPGSCEKWRYYFRPNWRRSQTKQCRDSNPGQLDVKSECYLKAPLSNFICIVVYYSY